MKAALLIRPGELRVGDAPEPVPGPGDVRIAVEGVGLCGSDLSVFSGKWTAPSYPWIQGHEAFGTVEDVGEGVAKGRIGEVVVVEPNVPCLACPECTTGLTSSCRRRQSVGMNRPGALAEKLVVPSAHAWPIARLPARDLVCVEPLAVVETALRRLGEVPKNVVVIGVGSQGLLMSLSLVSRKAVVYAHDLSSERLALAETLGARRLSADPANDVDLVVDTVGSPSSVELALRHLRIGGTLLFLGLEATPFEISAQTIVRRQLVIRGSLTYDHPHDFGVTVDRVQSGTIAPGQVITDEFSLDEAAEAFAGARITAGKTWIRVGRSAA